MTMKIYEVGGAVRDSILGIKSNDIDFAVEAGSFEEMERGLTEEGFKIFISKPQYLTVRASPPARSKLAAMTKSADFVLCRKDSSTGDGRRPDYVEPGTILEDLARRDFTMNAIARDPATDELLDPHNGTADLKERILRFVGDPMQRIREDGLRVLRAFRFMVCMNLNVADDETEEALMSLDAVDMLHKVSVERIRDELNKMFAHSTEKSVRLLAILPRETTQAIFRHGLWLKATLEEK